MTEIHLTQKDDLYDWTVYASNGKPLAESADYYNTKFHCKKMAEWLFPTFKLIDKTKDRRRRA